MRESARFKADRLLLEGRVVIEEVIPGEVRSTTRGEGHVWHQSFSGGIWTCSCPARSDQCSHLHALRRVVAVDLVGGEQR